MVVTGWHPAALEVPCLFLQPFLQARVHEGRGGEDRAGEGSGGGGRGGRGGKGKYLEWVMGMLFLGREHLAQHNIYKCCPLQ